MKNITMKDNPIFIANTILTNLVEDYKYKKEHHKKIEYSEEELKQFIKLTSKIKDLIVIFDDLFLGEVKND